MFDFVCFCQKKKSTELTLGYCIQSHYLSIRIIGVNYKQKFTLAVIHTLSSHGEVPNGYLYREREHE